jgi:hypothetical protein
MVRRKPRRNFKVLTRAADMGVTFWDTADVYGNGHNEGNPPPPLSLIFAPAVGLLLGGN